MKLECPTHDKARAALMGVLSDFQNRPNTERISVLEAGGGSLSHINFVRPPEITVVDISAEQLEKNDAASKKILGDLCEIDLGRDEFDMAVAWDVLEHLERPRIVVEKLFAAIRPGGIVVLAWPNPQSLRGLVTKWSPHWFHILVYRHILGHPNAGNPGELPFRTVYHRDIMLSRMKRIAQDMGGEIVYVSQYEREDRDVLRRFSRVLGWAFDSALLVGNWIGGGVLQATDIFMVLKKPNALSTGDVAPAV